MFNHKKNLQEPKSFSEREEYNTELLETISELVEENNEILTALKQSERRSNIFRFIYWMLVLGALSGIFYYLKPIVDFLFANFHNLKKLLYGVSQVSESLPETNNLKNIFNQLKQ